MSNVYYQRVDLKTPVDTIQRITRKLLETVVEKEHVTLEHAIPLKVHFGEKGNTTFIRSDNYQGIVDYLRERNIESSYIETLVMYGGQRHRKDLHLKIAEEHGFTQLPIIIADGEQGEAFAEVEINQKHFESCKIGKAFLDYRQMIVLSHFKGHTMAGFGGAIKQLSMGCAAKGGKMAMHMGIKPHIVNRKCKKCNLCQTGCNADAITIGKRSFIDHEKCMGCGACVSLCPHKAVSIITVKGLLRFAGFGNCFTEKLVEYAYAAQKDKRNIYINFAMNITEGCDCLPRKMKLLMDDIGVFISTDPVAIDKACYDLIYQAGKKFRGVTQFEYAEKIGLGSTAYQLIDLQDLCVWVGRS
ncbi:MAG: DUF362 domain-containing protein [Spartobacteria bacterium]|nr:DUF362 domain-containing protein [Spartobacteria bacterium]